jgi:hypothetical protein
MGVAGGHASVPAHGEWHLGDSNGLVDQSDSARADVFVRRTLGGVARIHQEDAEDTRVRSGNSSEASEGVAVMSEKHLGSSIDDFLKEEGIFEEAQAQAIKEVVAWQLAEAMRTKKISKSKMAALLKTSRSQVDRLLDPSNDITLGSLQRAAAVVGRRVSIELL